MGVRFSLAGTALCLSLLPALSAQTVPAPTYLTREQARPVFELLGESLPQEAVWHQSMAAADRATRARVAHGDETSVVNLLLFGTSFTREPRITSRQLDTRRMPDTLAARLVDFERAVAQPGIDERLQFARRTLGEDGQRRARLLAMIERAIEEGETYARLAEAAHALGDSSLEFAERSRLFRARGLSADTSVRANFAVEEALKQVYAGEGRKGTVQRVAIIGPGLDFADKQEGYDFYAQQTIQPFAVMDSLLRLGLASPDALSVTTFDLSARVNDHIEQSARRAQQGSSYVIHLPLDAGVSWTPEFLGYWRKLGLAIGSEATPAPVPAAVGPLHVRAVGVRPALVERVSARDVNVTAQYLPLRDAERFDLIVGTNVFVYYDRLQQGLAMASVASMLRPGGYLLSNNALLELPSVGLTSAGYSRTLYSGREEDGDLVIWYRMGVR